MGNNNVPIIVGVAQYTQHKGTSQPLDPLRLMRKTCSEAISNTGAEKTPKCIDSVYMVNIQSWTYPDAPGELSEKLGINPKNKVYLPDGGNSPQLLVNRAAKAIILGKSQGTLIVGGESSHSKNLVKKRVIKPDWPRSKRPRYIEGETLKKSHGSVKTIIDFENKYRLFVPASVYAMFETAIRVSRGRSIDEHNQHLGKLLEHYSKVASNNPYSWISKYYTAKDIITPTSENRYINHPYTKRMCANMFVDQSSALIVTNEDIAETLGIDREKWIYLMGYADLENIFTLTERPKLNNSPAAREGSRLALSQAGLKIEDIGAFELYSCFPSMVEILMKELGIPEDDPRDLTLTGGLPFFGGPWSNYSMHAIVSAVERIRKEPSLKAMIVANGGFNSKQSIGIYGNHPPTRPLSIRDDTTIQESILSEALQEPIIEANGSLTTEAYTFIFNRTGQILTGIVIGQLQNGRRTLANIEAEADVLEKLEKQELVGQSFKVSYNSERGLNLLIL